MSSPAPKIYPSKEMYQQILPSFVLRQFPFVPSNRLRQKVQDLWRKHNAPSERLFVYDLATGQLLQCPVPRVYSKPDVLQNLEHSTNIESVESKLADLEQDAATIVRAIHYGLQAGNMTISRKRLAILRKFIFVTQYRGLAVHIQGGDSVRMETKGPTSLTPRMEEWLQGLKYYLDTPHYDIIATGERLRERYGNSRLSEMLRSQSYHSEELAFQYAIEYENLANNYFLGVWVAPEESEFVLSGHAFSLWEGLISGIPGAHRLYILSPRIAIILRRTCLHDSRYNHPSVLYSSLADVPITKPTVQYAKEDLIGVLEAADPVQAKLVMSAYRTTPEAEEDAFRYLFTRLTPEQTYAVNEVIMMHTNLRHHGSVIFRQQNVMRETLNLYMASPATFLGGKQKMFRPLLGKLESQDDSQQGRSSSLPEGASESTPDCQLSLLLGFMIQDHVTFPSAYTRAFVIFHMATAASLSNPIPRRIRKIQDAAIDKLRCFLDPPLPEALQDGSCSGLVQSLDSEESELFFSLIGALLDRAIIDIRRSNDFFATVINEVAMIGVAYWLAEERPDFLKEILLPWVHIWS